MPSSPEIMVDVPRSPKSNRALSSISRYGTVPFVGFSGTRRRIFIRLGRSGIIDIDLDDLAGIWRYRHQRHAVRGGEAVPRSLRVDCHHSCAEGEGFCTPVSIFSMRYHFCSGSWLSAGTPGYVTLLGCNFLGGDRRVAYRHVASQRPDALRNALIAGPLAMLSIRRSRRLARRALDCGVGCYVVARKSLCQ